MQTNGLEDGDGHRESEPHYLLLGLPAVRHPDGLRSIRGRVQATLFSLLALQAGFPVSAESLIDAMWRRDVPADAVNALQSQVSRLRMAVGAQTIRFDAGMYVLDVDRQEVDTHLFEQFVRRARDDHEAGAHAAANAAVQRALALWRGTPFPELPDSEVARVEAARLEELRLQALVLRVEADLALHREGSAIITLRQLTASHPLREDLWSLLLVALYRSGRPADALAAYRSARDRLVSELGIEPGPHLRALERAVLSHDTTLLEAERICPSHLPSVPDGTAALLLTPG